MPLNKKTKLILNKAVYISHNADIPGKDMYPTILLPALDN